MPTSPQSANNAKRNVVTMAEPLVINPNPYANVAEVLKTIKSNAPTNKCWSAVGSDGVPYVLGQKLRDDPKNELTNLLLLPGPGHFEINTVKVLFRLLWPVAIEKVASLTGFRTTKALQYALKASDDHKAWPVCMEKLASLTGFRTTKALQYALKPSDHHTSWELLTIVFKATISIHFDTFIVKYQTSDTGNLILQLFEQWVADTDAFHKYIHVMCLRYILIWPCSCTCAGKALA